MHRDFELLAPRAGLDAGWTHFRIRYAIEIYGFDRHSFDPSTGTSSVAWSTGWEVVSGIAYQF